MQAFTKHVLVNSEVTILELGFLRSLFNMIVAVMIVKALKLPLFSTVTPEHRPAMAIRAIFGTVGFLGFIAGVMFIPVAIFFIITGSSILTTALLTCLCLKESISPVEGVAMVAALAGIVMIGMAEDTQAEGEDAHVYAETHNYALGITISVFATACLSVTQITSRMLKSINFAVIQFVYAFTAVVVLGSCVVAEKLSTGKGSWFIYSNWKTYGEIFGVAALNMIAQNCLVYTNQNANPTTVSLMLYVGVFYSFFIDKYLFAHVYSGLELSGVMLCLVCSVSAALYKWKI